MRLSCPTTFFNKVILGGGIILLLFASIAFNGIAWLRGTSAVSGVAIFMLSVGCVAIVTFTYRMVGSLKALRIDGDQLIISNYLKSIKTPLTNVAEISGPDYSSHRRVRVRFKEATEFGDQIIFMPPLLAAKSTTDDFRRAVERAEKSAGRLAM